MEKGMSEVTIRPNIRKKAITINESSMQQDKSATESRL